MNQYSFNLISNTDQSEICVLVNFVIVIGCIVTFQADPYDKRPAESSTGFQASTIAQTSEVCAGRCYQVFLNFQLNFQFKRNCFAINIYNNVEELIL